MTDPWQKSKKPSNGKRGKRQLNPTFYLDENFDCREVREGLERSGVKYRVYRQDVPANSGIEDNAFLPKVGKEGWLLITCDWHQRVRPREAKDLKRYGVKHFALSGNLGAAKMAELLVSAKNDILACARDHQGHLSATIQKDGRVNVLRDQRGSLYERGESKSYYKGRIHISKPH